MLFTRKQDKPHVPSKVKAFGRARLEIAQRAQDREAWDNLWKPPMQEFPFEWGPHWKQCVEYKVDDFSTEVGFLIDVLGLPVNAFNPDYAMFTSPERDFFFAVVQTSDGMKSTPPDALRIQFMVADIFALTEKLKGRGVQFEGEPGPVAEGSEQWVASFRTPHGIHLEIWGLVEMVPDRVDKPQTERKPETAAPADGRNAHIEVDRPTTRLLPADEMLEDESLDEALSDQDLAEEDQVDEFLSVERESVERQSRSQRDSEFDDAASGEYRYSRKVRTTEVDETPSNESTRYQPQVAEPKPQYTVKHKALELPESAEAEQPDRASESASSHNGHRKKVRLLPRSAVRAAVPSAITSPSLPQAADREGGASFKPAPKKSEPEKTASIWDDFSEDVEYLDLEEPSEEDDYHYKPIPLNRDE